MQDDDPYRVLGLGRDAGARDLKRAYRALSLAWHPDRHGDAPEEVRLEAERRFKQIHAAYLAVGTDLRAGRNGHLGAPPAPPGDVGAVTEAICAAVASAALRVLVTQSRHSYRRVVEVAERLLKRAVAEGEVMFGAGLEPPLQAVMWAVGMDPPLRPSVVRVLLLVTSELPYCGEGPEAAVWLGYLAPLERALREAPLD